MIQGFRVLGDEGSGFGGAGNLGLSTGFRVEASGI